MWVLVRATVRAGWEPPVRRLARKLLSPQSLSRYGRGAGFHAVGDKVRHGAAVQPCRLHVVWRKA